MTAPKKKPMAAWMVKQLKAKHPAAFDHKAHWVVCRCGATVLVGADWTYDWCWVATLDPQQLDTSTELVALMAGRRTFEVIIRDKVKTIRQRDQWRIGGVTPEQCPDYVFPAHQCRAPPIGVVMKPKQLNQPRTTP